MMERKVSIKSAEEGLGILSSLDVNKLKEAKEIAEQIKQILIAEAKQHSILDTSTERNANKLVEIMFNRFHLTDFDNLFEELTAISPSPINPVMPEYQSHMEN